MYHKDNKTYTNLCVHLFKNLFTRHRFCIKDSADTEDTAANFKNYTRCKREHVAELSDRIFG